MSWRLSLLLLAVLAGLVALLVVDSASDVQDRDAPATAPSSPPPSADTALERPRAEAAQDSDVRMVETYLGYTPRELGLDNRPHGNVHAEDLITLMTDATKDFGLRRGIGKALFEGARSRGDPDLSVTLLRDGYSARARFCKLYVADALTSDDRQTRMLAHDFLGKLWGGAAGGFDPDEPKTWAPARLRWRKFLKGR